MKIQKANNFFRTHLENIIFSYRKLTKMQTNNKQYKNYKNKNKTKNCNEKIIKWEQTIIDLIFLCISGDISKSKQTNNNMYSEIHRDKVINIFISFFILIFIE